MERKAFTEQAMERKSFQVELKEANENDLTVTHFISTERRDRGGDILLAAGMITEGKVVVLHSHGSGPLGSEPVAKNIWLKVAEYGNHRGILAKTKFFPDETGRRLFAKTSQGYSPNWSVGWRPIRWRMERDQATNDETRVVESWELLEYSLVSVPMQPDAQTLAFKGIGRKAKKQTIEIPDSLITDIFKKTIPSAIREAVQQARGKVK